MPKFYETKIKDIFQELSTQDTGLTSEQAQQRLKHYGYNKLPEQKPRSTLKLFFSQFASPLIYVLLSAAVIVLFIGETSDTVIIFVVLLFNAIVGTIQESKAQNTLRALKVFAETKAIILRDGSEVVRPDLEVVPGDIIILEEGSKVPADLRILSANGLLVDEAALTGESQPVRKSVSTLTASTLPLAEQVNMVFKGTHIVSGNGVAVAIATGAETEIGKISQEISRETDDSPLKTDIAFLSKLVIGVVSLIALLLFFIGALQEKTFVQMLTTVVALSVSIIPEGLPIVMTLVLATGVWRMTKRHALVKKLQAVESLGQATIIAVDKTGTITKNEMVVRKIYTAGKIYEIDGEGYEPIGKSLPALATLTPLLQAAALSANARIALAENQRQWIAVGDPTEAAMVCLAQKFGFEKDKLEIEYPRKQEIPFDYRAKHHVVVNTINEKLVATMAAAPEVAVALSSLPKKDQEQELATAESLSAQGLRVIGLASKPLRSKQALAPTELKNFEFLGFVGIQDTIRPEAKEALQAAEQAGMKVVMITGDNKITAQAIAQEVGIYKPGSVVLTGPEIDAMDENVLAEKVGPVTVFARVTPEHKLRIIKAYQTNREIIAMTGDGVNDAPSLVAADLGVAMGKIGTEVAKEAADIVLLDDNFGSIVAAIDEGRSIYKTIKKVILYLFSTSFGEALTITVALILDWPLPLLASQIIWLNLVTDGFLDVSLAMEPKEEGLLQQRFFQPKRHLLDGLMVQRMLVMAVPMVVGSLIMFHLHYEQDMVKAWTVTLTVLAVFQWFNAWNCRHESKSLLHMSLLGNKFLVGATLIIVVLHLLAVYHPFMQRFLHTTALTGRDWIMVIAMGSSIVVIEELRKYFYRKKFVPRPEFTLT